MNCVIEIIRLDPELSLACGECVFCQEALKKSVLELLTSKTKKTELQLGFR